MSAHDKPNTRGMKGHESWRYTYTTDPGCIGPRIVGVACECGVALDWRPEPTPTTIAEPPPPRREAYQAHAEHVAQLNPANDPALLRQAVRDALALTTIAVDTDEHLPLFRHGLTITRVEPGEHPTHYVARLASTLAMQATLLAAVLEQLELHETIPSAERVRRIALGMERRWLAADIDREEHDQ